MDRVGGRGSMTCVMDGVGGGMTCVMDGVGGWV